MSGEFRIGGAGPGKPSGAYVNGEHIGHLMVYINPVEEERTSNRDKEKYIVAVCPFVICLSDRKAWADTDVSGKALAPRLLTAANEIIAVRLIEGEAKEGWNAPIVPEDANAAETADVQVLLSKYGARLPAGRIIFDVIAYNNDNPPPGPEAF